MTIIPAIIFLVTAPYKNSAFVRFHSYQSLALAGVIFVGNIVLGIIPLVNRLLVLADLALMVCWIICIVKASQGNWFKLPVVGEFALRKAKA